MNYPLKLGFYSHSYIALALDFMSRYLSILDCQIHVARSRECNLQHFRKMRNRQCNEGATDNVWA